MRILWIAAVVLFIDQATKVVVRNTMYRSQSIPLLGDWLKFTFTENPGMAFGIVFGPPGLVTVFSIAATALIVYYMYKVRGGYTPYLASLSLILGGALGNIIDRVFYGWIFGYADLFKGRVVDFIHVDLWRGYVPDGVPLIGGDYLALFPIWNVADMAIVVGVVGILVFQRGFHARLQEQLEQGEEAGEQALPAGRYEAAASESSPVVSPDAPASTNHVESSRDAIAPTERTDRPAGEQASRSDGEQTSDPKRVSDS